MKLSRQRRAAPPTVLQCRVDYLQLAFRGELRPEARAQLAERLAEARRLRTAVAVDLGPGLAFALSAATHDGLWRLENGDMRVRVDDAAPNGWRVEVTPRAVLLGRRPAAAVVATAVLVGTALLEAVADDRVRRVDLCADLVDFGLSDVDPDAWLTPRRARVGSIATLTEYSRAAVRTGFAIGKSDIRLRVYDKTEELRLDTNDGAKRDEEHARWRCAGWNGVEDVVRVEFQVRGSSLKELGIRTPGALLERLDATWGYCGSRWARLVDLSTATRRCRCADDIRWTIVKSVTFDRDDAKPATRTRNRSLARARLAVGTALNFAASAGVLRQRNLGDARTEIAGFTDREAEAFVRRELARSVHAASYAVAEDLLRAYGPHDAAAYVLERVSVAHARASRLGEVTGTVRTDTDRDREFVGESPAVAAPNSDADAANRGTQAVGDAPSVPGGIADGCYRVRS